MSFRIGIGCVSGRFDGVVSGPDEKDRFVRDIWWTERPIKLYYMDPQLFLRFLDAVEPDIDIDHVWQVYQVTPHGESIPVGPSHPSFEELRAAVTVS